MFSFLSHENRISWLNIIQLNIGKYPYPIYLFPFVCYFISLFAQIFDRSTKEIIQNSGFSNIKRLKCCRYTYLVFRQVSVVTPNRRKQQQQQEKFEFCTMTWEEPDIFSMLMLLLYWNVYKNHLNIWNHTRMLNDW